MRIYKAKDYEDMSRKAANVISAQVIMKPDCVLGLATGLTPEGIYKQLIEWYKKGDLSFDEVKTVNLDEYQGVKEEDNRSYHYYMKEKFFQHVNIKPENYYLPNGTATNVEAECIRYDNIISYLSNIDLQLLGLGRNGHIGFNEPGVSFNKGTHLVELSQSTIDANFNSINKNENIPKYAYTMGIKNILQARKIVLAVSGKNKAKILYEVMNGPITSQVPASILQLHKDVTIIADEDALSFL